MQDLFAGCGVDGRPVRLGPCNDGRRVEPVPGRGRRPAPTSTSLPTEKTPTPELSISRWRLWPRHATWFAQRVAAGLAGDILVLIRGGIYEQVATLAFGPQDSGTEKYSITYAAYRGEKVVLSGGRISIM